MNNSIENLSIDVEKKLYLCRSELSDEMVTAIKKGECLGISFSYGEWPDLSFLKELEPPLQRLSALSENIDWQSVSELSDLQVLRVDRAIKKKVNFSSLTNLAHLRYYWDKKNADNVFSLQGIECLQVYGAKALDFSIFENMTSLKKLEIVRGSFTNLDGIGALKGLKSLRLENMTKLEDISALNDAHSLISLAISSCSRVNIPDAFSGLKQVRKLTMLKIKQLESLKFLKSLTSLEALGIFEMSIKSGDVRCLSELSSLKSIRMDSRRHYNMDLDEFESELIARYGDFELDIDKELGLSY